MNGPTSTPTLPAEAWSVRHKRFGFLLRFVVWWFSFFVLLGPLSVCPICRQPGCAGGTASTGILGGSLPVDPANVPSSP